MADTLAAGAGLCDEFAVRAILGAGLAAVGALRSAAPCSTAALVGARPGGRASGLSSNTPTALGQLYTVSTNADGATGDGVALALRAGAMVADLEFVQFHPTVLHVAAGSRGRQPLVTEAIRGDGAVVDITGFPMMTGLHPLGALAPRNVVAAAITRRMAQTGTDHVLLDATYLRGAEFRRRFPTVYAACMAQGVDPGRAPIPVAPAAHYRGGVITDAGGRSTVPGLYATGELARTGLHGANRLTSNSLLEGLVMGEQGGYSGGVRLRGVAAPWAAAAVTPGVPGGCS